MKINALKNRSLLLYGAEYEQQDKVPEVAPFCFPFQTFSAYSNKG